MPLPQAEIRSILFVCWGNICRSPSAENVMRELLDGSELSYVRCDSAGTMNAHRGNPPDPRMSAAGKRRGLPMTGSARGIKSKDFHEFDLILAMDQANFDDLRRLAPNEAGLSRVRMFCEFCREFNETEVPDPYYGGLDGFENVLDLLEDGCQGLLEELHGNQQRKSDESHS